VNIPEAGEPKPDEANPDGGADADGDADMSAQ